MMTNSTSDFRISISKEQIALMEPISFQGGITLVDTPEGVTRAMAEICRHSVIGFDTETRPSFQKGKVNKVALMQLSTANHCWLIRLNKVGITSELRAFIENSEIRKIGLSVHDDFRVMHRSSEFEPRGFVDLQKIVPEFKIADISLQKIYAIIFGRKISKRQRLTNWEAPSLTPEQMQYAALDAWACLKIDQALATGMFNPENSPYKVYPPEPDSEQ